MGTLRIGAVTLGFVVAVLLGTATPAWALPGPPLGVGLGPNPWGCTAVVASPLPSDGAVTVHGTIRCTSAVPTGTSTVTLWRSGWFGWTLVDQEVQTVTSAESVDAVATWNPGMDCHYYRGTAVFSASGDGRTYDAGVITTYDQRFLRGADAGCGVNWG